MEELRLVPRHRRILPEQRRPRDLIEPFLGGGRVAGGLDNGGRDYRTHPTLCELQRDGYRGSRTMYELRSKPRLVRSLSPMRNECPRGRIALPMRGENSLDRERGRRRRLP